jgi:uncharacterized protein YkwD
MKAVLRFSSIIAVGLGIFFYQNGLPKSLPSMPQGAQVIDSQPEPLKVSRQLLSSERSDASLTAGGVIKYTNAERVKQSLPELSVSDKLNSSAKMKLDDMFANGYFDHTSPSGITLTDLGARAGYDYILIGENLAQGDFKDDQSLVAAWMASPHHRENILNARYTEIGVAVGYGMFNGKDIWIAVQHFGRPADLCPEIDQALKEDIDRNKARIDQLASELNLQSAEAAALLAYVKDFSKVKEYNYLISETSKEVDQYNNEVTAFNSCIRN